MKKLSKYLFSILITLSHLSSFGQQMPQAIAHALGSIDGYTYTNSREAMISSIEKGYKFLEVDMELTSDSVLVACHDWEHYNNITGHSNLKDLALPFKEFNKKKIYKYYTPITVQEIIDTLMNHPDISIVTDKISDPYIIEKYFSNIKDRTYIECFSEEDYFELKEKGYNAMRSAGNAVEYSLNEITKNLLKGIGRIDFLVVDIDSNLKDLNKLKCIMPLKISMYTINSEDELEENKDDIVLFYSDYYNPSTGTFNTTGK